MNAAGDAVRRAEARRARRCANPARPTRRLGMHPANAMRPRDERSGREPGTPLVLVAAPTRGGREAKPRTECDAQPSH